MSTLAYFSSMERQMRISIIVPIYNVENYVEKCIKSIKEQSFNDFECLLVNDGSEDTSMKICNELIKNDGRFIILNKENGGLSDARNFGLKQAKGEYVCFIDSDDYVDRDLLKLTYECAKKYDSDIVCFDLYYQYDNKMKISKGANFDNKSSFAQNKEIIFSNNSANNKLYRRTFLNNKEFIKGMWYEDLAVIPVWMAEANNISYVAKALYYYVQRKGSISHSANPKLFDIYTAIEMIKNNLNLTSYDVRKLYFSNCLVMTILRIKEIDDKKIRLEYYKKNIECLNRDYPKWYSDVKKEKEFNIKQRIIFSLLYRKKYKLVDSMYNQ